MDLESVMTRLRELAAEAAKGNGRGSSSRKAASGSSASSTLCSLQKQLGIDHDLALQLWQTGEPLARCLATRIADPDDLTPGDATQWMKDVDSPEHEEAVANVVARSAFGVSKMRQWRKQKSEYARTTGYAILSCLLAEDPESVDDLECERILKDITTEIHRSPNRARHAMVLAVIAIGIHKPELRDEALEAGELIGDVHVIHDETSGPTPRIGTEIKRATKRSARRKSTRVRA